MKRYLEELNELGFSPAQKERLLANLTAEKKRRRGLPYRGAVALVAAASLVVGAAGAASLAGVSPEFRELFGITGQEEAESLGALFVEETFADKNGSGASITVRETVSDQERLYVLLDFAAPEGTVLPVPEGGGQEHGYLLSRSGMGMSFYQDRACTQTANPSGLGYSAQYLPDSDPEDNVITFLITVTADPGIPEEAAYFRLSGIDSLCTLNGEEIVPLVDGLDLEAVVPIGGSVTYSFEGRCPVKLGGTTLAVVENLTISSISISLDLVIPDGGAYDAALEAAGGAWPVYVLLNDGTRVKASFPQHSSGRLDRYSGEDGQEFFRADHVVLTLERPIDLGMIENIIFVGDNDLEDVYEPGEVYFWFSPNSFSNNSYWREVNEYWSALYDGAGEEAASDEAAAVLVPGKL